MNSIQQVLKKHNLENIDQALDKIINSPGFKPKKPKCNKCNKEVDFCSGVHDFYTNTYSFDIRCHGESEIVQGDSMESLSLNEYIFDLR